MIVVLMGVSGSGKSTVGKLLAQKTGWVFAEGDDFHSPENREKMRQGIPLTGRDRLPWLNRLHQLLLAWDKSGTNGILSCSALRRSYRFRLCWQIADKRIRFIWLDVSRPVLEERLRQRRDHYMNPKLLSSQLETLEPPTDQEAMRLSGDQPAHEIVRQILESLRGAEALSSSRQENGSRPA